MVTSASNTEPVGAIMNRPTEGITNSPQPDVETDKMDVSNYDDFLRERRKMMANMIEKYYKSL